MECDVVSEITYNQYMSLSFLCGRMFEIHLLLHVLLVYSFSITNNPSYGVPQIAYALTD